MATCAKSAFYLLRILTKREIFEIDLTEKKKKIIFRHKMATTDFSMIGTALFLFTIIIRSRVATGDFPYLRMK